MPAPPVRLDPLGQLVRVALGADSVRGAGRFIAFRLTQVRVISEREFDEGPRARIEPAEERAARRGQAALLVGAIGDADWPWTAWPWTAALPRRQALIAAETALALSFRRRGGGADFARRSFRRARTQDRFLREQPESGFEATEAAFYRAVAEVVAGAARALSPPATTRDRRFVNTRRTAFYQRWWTLVKRRLAFADVTRAEITITRKPRGVIVRPAILGRLAGALDADRELLGRCF